RCHPPPCRRLITGFGQLHDVIVALDVRAVAALAVLTRVGVAILGTRAARERVVDGVDVLARVSVAIRSVRDVATAAGGTGDGPPDSSRKGPTGGWVERRMG